MPEKTAESATKCMDVRVARMRASVVFRSRAAPTGRSWSVCRSPPCAVWGRLPPEDGPAPRFQPVRTVSGGPPGTVRKGGEQAGASSFSWCPSYAARRERQGRDGGTVAVCRCRRVMELSGKGFVPGRRKRERHGGKVCIMAAMMRFFRPLFRADAPARPACRGRSRSFPGPFREVGETGPEGGIVLDAGSRVVCRRRTPDSRSRPVFSSSF